MPTLIALARAPPETHLERLLADARRQTAHKDSRVIWVRRMVTSLSLSLLSACSATTEGERDDRSRRSDRRREGTSEAVGGVGRRRRERGGRRGEEVWIPANRGAVLLLLLLEMRMELWVESATSESPSLSAAPGIDAEGLLLSLSVTPPATIRSARQRIARPRGLANPQRPAMQTEARTGVLAESESAVHVALVAEAHEAISAREARAGVAHDFGGFRRGEDGGEERL